MVVTEGKYISDVLRFEVDKNFCRGRKQIEAGQSLAPGDVCEDNSSSRKVQVTAAVNEVQSIVFAGTPTGGTFVLWIENIEGIMVPTGALAYNASAATTTTALNLACGVTNGIVATGTTLPDQTYTFTYSGTGYAGVSKSQIVADITALTGGAPTAVESTTTNGHASGSEADAICLETVACLDEIQTLVFAGTPTGGTFTLTFWSYASGGWVTTAAIAYDASAATVTTAVNLVVGTDALVVTGTTLPDQTLTVTWDGASHSGRTQPLVTYDLSSLTGGTPTLVVARTTQGAGAWGNFLIRGPARVVYSGLDYNSQTEANVDAALNALNIIVETTPTYTEGL